MPNSKVNVTGSKQWYPRKGIVTRKYSYKISNLWLSQFKSYSKVKLTESQNGRQDKTICVRFLEHENKIITRKKLNNLHVSGCESRLQQTIGRDISIAKCSGTGINSTGSSDNTKASSEVLGYSRLVLLAAQWPKTPRIGLNLVMVKSSYE